MASKKHLKESRKDISKEEKFIEFDLLIMWKKVEYSECSISIVNCYDNDRRSVARTHLGPSYIGQGKTYTSSSITLYHKFSAHQKIYHKDQMHWPCSHKKKMLSSSFLDNKNRRKSVSSLLLTWNQVSFLYNYLQFHH